MVTWEVPIDKCVHVQQTLTLNHYESILEINTPQPSPVCSGQKWWQDRQEAENEKAAKQSITQPAGVKGPSDTSVAKRGAKRGRGGPGQGRMAVAITKAPAPAPSTPIRGGKAARPPAKTPAARWVTLAAWGKRLADLMWLSVYVCWHLFIHGWFPVDAYSSHFYPASYSCQVQTQSFTVFQSG